MDLPDSLESFAGRKGTITPHLSQLLSLREGGLEVNAGPCFPTDSAKCAEWMGHRGRAGLVFVVFLPFRLKTAEGMSAGWGGYGSDRTRSEPQKSAPHGLKPRVPMAAFMARLKSCPYHKTRSIEFFSKV